MGYGEEHAWTQMSGLWRLPYMDDLFLPHNIDMIHLEKNIAEALWGTIMDILDKTKDNVNARVDQASLCDRPKLNISPPKDGKKWKKPAAEFVLKKHQRKEVLEWFHTNVPRWVCSESKERGQLIYYANQWAEES